MPFAALPLLLFFAFSLFVSATLLFLVQPMIGKMLLPMLGGTPAVWNTCMVFFQALLLAGYAYAHATTAWLGVRKQAILHIIVLLLPMLTFFTTGLTVNRALLDYGESNPIPGLLLVLLLSVGLPFFVVSTSAPLLQMWFAGTGHPASRDPYFLYGASNLGSMLALFGYPLVVEPNLTLAEQRLLWQIGYGLLALLTAGCAICLLSSRQHSGSNLHSEEASTPTAHSPLTFARRMRWVALAFVPSSLMLGVTTYMTTDIAAIPLLWVLPLGLYLLSFILVFSRLPAGVHRLMVAMLPFIVLLLLFLMLSEFPLKIWWKILVHVAVLFVVAMVCHGELARDRPSTRHLTGFYMWMSVGGVLGGLFNALVAPVIFNGIVEYPLALVLACLLMPSLEPEKKSRGIRFLEAGLMGCYLGMGLALMLPALGRADLNMDALRGLDGIWIVVSLVVTCGAGILYALANREDRAARWLDLGMPLALAVLAIGLFLGLRIPIMHRGLELFFVSIHDALPSWVPARIANFFDPRYAGLLTLVVYITPIILCSFFMSRPLRFGLGVAMLMVASTFCDLLDEDVKLRQRSFFGVMHVVEIGNFRKLEHGTTLHGMQRHQWSTGARLTATAAALAATDPLSGAILVVAGQDVQGHPGREPMTYFHRTGPVGQVFAAYEEKLAGKRLGLIGLGTGTLAAYVHPGQRVTYFEIDPLVKRIAYDPSYFTFVKDALDRKVDLEVILGDARLKLEERAHQHPSEKLALLLVDAFSSDSIPIHLITRQALEIYLENLADDGLLIFHISNRYLDLEPVLGNLAEVLNLTGFIELDFDNKSAEKASSNWVVMARHQSVLDNLIHEGRWEQWKVEHRWEASLETLMLLSTLPDFGGTLNSSTALCAFIFPQVKSPWRKLKVNPDVGVWSDDYSNLLKVFIWKN